MAYVDFLGQVHTGTKRDYLARVLAGNKAEFATIAKRFDRDYWDGSRDTDGRWLAVAERMVAHYGVKPGARILDVGCGKGFLLHEFTKIVPGAEIVGLDVSAYALENAMDEVKPRLQLGNAVQLPFPDGSFDLVVSINTLHNLRLPELDTALREIERVGRGAKYILMDGYRTEQEKVNLLYWQLTCECFFTPEEWEWLFRQCGYNGDYGCVFFE
jgi:ubiquinone/menaquinone biosynthesis C-methylase UbiE